nr:MAG TPA: hypothetical protein [Caudoviricetes sp.]
MTVLEGWRNQTIGIVWGQVIFMLKKLRFLNMLHKTC